MTDTQTDITQDNAPLLVFIDNETFKSNIYNEHIRILIRDILEGKPAQELESYPTGLKNGFVLCFGK